MNTSFWKVFASTWLALLTFTIAVIVAAVILIASLTISKQNGISSPKVLKIVVDEQLVEREYSSVYDKIQNGLGAGNPAMGLWDLNKAIRLAAENPEIKGIYLELRMPEAGFASLEELRASLAAFKAEGKWIVAYGEYMTEKTYYLASLADEVYLPPMGILELNGLKAESLYFKEMLTRLGVKVEVFKAGDFKSAVEPFTQDHMGDSDRVQIRQYMESVYGQILSQIGASRKINPEVLRTLSDSLLIRNAQDALKAGLITRIGYQGDAEKWMKDKMAITEEGKTLPFISYKSILETEAPLSPSDKEGIALIFANGEINSGKGNQENIGSVTLIQQIRAAARDEKIKGVIIRVESPGGSALASDVIWHELNELKKRKPLYASMSNYAASGGYYIAMAADTIFANTYSLTGSIGVFGLLFNGEELLQQKLGITTDREMTGAFSDIGSLTRPMKPEEASIIQTGVDEIYQDFITKVAAARGKTKEEIHQLARGRIWSGIDAKANGLIDLNGNLQDCIEALASKCGFKDQAYQIKLYPSVEENLWAGLIENDEDNKAKPSPVLETLLPKEYALLRQMASQKEPVQTRMPYVLFLK